MAQIATNKKILDAIKYGIPKNFHNNIIDAKHYELDNCRVLSMQDCIDVFNHFGIQFTEMRVTYVYGLTVYIVKQDDLKYIKRLKFCKKYLNFFKPAFFVIEYVELSQKRMFPLYEPTTALGF